MKADGDLHVDDHHTVEDVGIAFGQCVRQALGDKRGITRYASAYLPMDEALTRCALDISGRPFLVFRTSFHTPKIGTFDTQLVEEWFRAFAMQSGITLHVETLYGSNDHHIAESCFKALARALRVAVSIDPAQADRVPSTKAFSRAEPMAIYTVHAPADVDDTVDAAGAGRIRFIRDGFAVWALILPGSGSSGTACGSPSWSGSPPWSGSNCSAAASRDAGGHPGGALRRPPRDRGPRHRALDAGAARLAPSRRRRGRRRGGRRTALLRGLARRPHDAVGDAGRRGGRRRGDPHGRGLRATRPPRAILAPKPRPASSGVIGLFPESGGRG